MEINLFIAFVLVLTGSYLMGGIFGFLIGSIRGKLRVYTEFDKERVGYENTIKNYRDYMDTQGESWRLGKG